MRNGVTKSRVPPSADDPAESRRFIDMAREVEVDESPGAFDRAFKKVARPPKAPAGRISTGDRAQDVALVAPQWERGRAGAAARARKLSLERRVEIARKAAAARWGK